MLKSAINNTGETSTGGSDETTFTAGGPKRRAVAGEAAGIASTPAAPTVLTAAGAAALGALADRHRGA